jgi:AcrR family transcriptional regulator
MVMADVKRGGARAEKARQTRERMRAAARDLFVGQGYGATTLQDVADRAGVAVQTIYFTFGTKRNLLKELVDTGIAGDEQPIATMERPWFHDALAEDTADAVLRAYVAGTRRILERVAAITEMLRVAAATDPDIRSMWPQEQDPRYTVQTAVAKVLIRKPDARGDLTVKHAADVLFGLLSPELYLVLTRDRGWTAEKWEHWAHETLGAQLCRRFSPAKIR